MRCPQASREMYRSGCAPGASFCLGAWIGTSRTPKPKDPSHLSALNLIHQLRRNSTACDPGGRLLRLEPGLTLDRGNRRVDWKNDHELAVRLPSSGAQPRLHL